MSIAEFDRSSLVAKLIEKLGSEDAETLMRCILLEGKDALATKDDLAQMEARLEGELTNLKISHAELKSVFAEHRSHMDTSLEKLKAQQAVSIAELSKEFHGTLARQSRYVMVSFGGTLVLITLTLLTLFGNVLGVF